MIILTKQAQNRSILKGMDLNEIKYIIERGVKTRKNNTIISTLNNKLVIYTQNGLITIVKMVATK